MSTRPVAPQFPVVSFLQRRTRTERWIAGSVAGLLAALWLIRFTGATLLDRWWYDSVTTAPVWSTRLVAQIELAAAAAIITAAVLGIATHLVLTVGPAPENGPNRIVVRYQQRMGPAHRWLLIGLVVLLTVQVIPAAMDRWQQWVLFTNGPNLGTKAPEIGFDLGYHLFRLPFLTIVGAWARRLLLIAGGIAIFGHIATGALKLPGRGRRSARRALAHIGGIGAGLAFLQGLLYLFVQRPALATNRTGAFDGPGFTELRIISPGLIVLAVIALITAVAAGYGVWTGRWRPVIISTAVWALAYAVALWVLPAAVQTIVVRPAEAERELPFIAHNLEATRTAYQLDSIEIVTEEYTDGLSELPDVQTDELMGRVPVFTDAQLIAPLQVLEGSTATRITDVDLDRYVIDGVTRPVLIAARNTSQTDLPERGWVQSHLVYTHGDGVIAVPADTTAPDGRPDVDSLALVLSPDRPEIYFGEGLANWYAIVNTKRKEQGGVSFAADTGIAVSGFWSRLVTAIGLGDIEPLTSSELTSESQLLFRRSLQERVSALAPFVRWDAEAYPVVVDGRITWIMEGYTTASTYPYSQFAGNTRLNASSPLSGVDYNYVHGSVKATIDAYDGTVHLYETAVGGTEDPLLQAWKQIFPGLLEPIANMPEGLQDHLLYAPDLFKVQTSMLGRYHVSDPEVLFNGSDRWSVSPAPGDGVAQDSPGLSNAVSLFLPTAGDLQGHWVAIRPYDPGASSNPSAHRDLLAAFAVADHDNPEHMMLVRIAERVGRQVSTPQVAQSAIDTDPDLAEEFTLLNANGSIVQFGPMTPLPLNGAMIWVRPIIVTGTADTTAPRLFGVTAVSNGIVGVAQQTTEAVAATIAR